MAESVDGERFLMALETQLEKLSVEKGLAMYNMYQGDNSADMNEIESRISAIYLDPANFEKLAEIAKTPLNTNSRIAVSHLRRWFTLGQVSRHPDVYKLRNEIEKEILSFRPTVGGTAVSRTEAREILRKEEHSRLRKEAYFCELPLARAIRGQVLELARLRRDLARDIGASNYPDFALSLQDNNVKEMRRLFEFLEEQTGVQFGNYLMHLGAEAGLDEIMPWDVQFLFEKKRLPDAAFSKEGIMPAVNEVFGGMGFGIEKLGIDIKYRDIPFGGLCFGIRVPDDVRILANPQNGHNFYGIIFHEFGHAVYSKLVEQSHYALKGDVSNCFTEGMAVFFSRFVEDREWLLKRPGLTREMVDDYADRLTYNRIFRLRGLMSRALLEYHIYEDTEQDIEALWAQLNYKFLMTRSEPSEIWAASPFNVSHPVYLHNYVLAEMIAQQIYDYLNHHYATLLGNRVVSKFMIRNFFAPGGSVSWRDKVKYATDKPLGPGALLASIGVKQ